MAEVCVRISFVILKSLIAFGMGLSIVAMTFALLVSASPNAARSAEKVWRIGYFGGAKRVNPAFSQAFAAMARAGADAPIMVVDRLVAVHRRRLIGVATKQNLPTMCWRPAMARDGCLMSYGADRTAMVRRSATYVVKILRGANPAEMPIEQPAMANFDIACFDANPIVSVLVCTDILLPLDLL